MAGQIWAVADEGGSMWSPNLSDYLRIQNQTVAKWRQMCDVKENDGDGRPLLGKHGGDYWSWNCYSNLSTGGRELDETEPMPASGFKVLNYTAKVREYGNSVSYTGKLDDLSAQPIMTLIDKLLKIDTAKTLDVAAWKQFDQTLLVVTPLSGTSTTALDALSVNGVPVSTNNVAFGVGHVDPIVTLMQERGIPAFEEGDYFAVGRPSSFTQLKSDMRSIQEYTETGLVNIKNGEIGRVGGTRFIMQTNIPQGAGNYNTTTTLGTYNPASLVAQPWANAKSDGIYFMGADTVSEGVVIPEEIRGGIPTDFGRKHAICWYAILGFALTHPDALNGRVIKWGSAT